MNPPIRYLSRKFILFAYILLLGENLDSQPASSNTQVPLGRALVRQRTSLSHNNAAAAAADIHETISLSFPSTHPALTCSLKASGKYLTRASLIDDCGFVHSQVPDKCPGTWEQ